MGWPFSMSNSVYLCVDFSNKSHKAATSRGKDERFRYGKNVKKINFIDPPWQSRRTGHTSGSPAIRVGAMPSVDRRELLRILRPLDILGGGRLRLLAVNEIFVVF